MSADPSPRPPESVAEAMKGWPGRQAWEQPPAEPVAVELLQDAATDAWWAVLVAGDGTVMARHPVTDAVNAIIAQQRARWDLGG